MPLSRSRERLLRRIATRKGREAERVVLLEGGRAVETALDAKAEILFAVTVADESAQRSSAESAAARAAAGAVESAAAGAAEGAIESGGGAVARDAGLLGRLQALGIDVDDVPAGAFAELAATETPQGLLAVAREPSRELPTRPTGEPPRVLVLDRIQEPGNVGALIRAAAALGIERVLVLDGTADPWGSKAVRASAGLAFALPIHGLPWGEARRWIEEACLALLVADGRGADVRAWLAARGSDGAGWALVLANEGAGARAEILEAADARLAVPIAEGVESLNVASAGSILLWTLGPGADPPPSPGASP